MQTVVPTFPNARPRDLELGTGAPKARTSSVKAHALQRDAGDEGDPILVAKAQFATKQLPDPFRGHYGPSQSTGEASGLLIVEPDFPLDELARLCAEDVTLGSCIDSMATNVSHFGYTLEYVGPDDQAESKESVAEKTRIVDMLERCNPDESISQVLGKANMDYNTFGHSYLELGRDASDNVDFVYHIPAQTMRATVTEEDEQKIEIWLRRNGVLTNKKAYKRFRRFVQIRKKDNRKMFFKEFGDPRVISSTTGNEDPNIPIEDEAVEVIWLNRYSPGYVYGLPKYISCVAAVLGTREAALTNLDFFKDNAIPALAILVAGGMLADDAITSLRNQFTKNTGRKVVNRAVVLEARTPQEDMPLDGSAPPTPRIDIKPLAQDRQGDALFQHYTKNNMEQVRQAFRLPPLIVGLASDYTRATAEASIDIAEAQVFGPERQVLDDVVNSKILLKDGKPCTYWRYRSNPPRMASPEAQALAVERLNNVGAMTPNIAITIANQVFGFRIPPVKEKWGDLPYELTKQVVNQGHVTPETDFPEGKVPPAVEAAAKAKEKGGLPNNPRPNMDGEKE